MKFSLPLLLLPFASAADLHADVLSPRSPEQIVSGRRACGVANVIDFTPGFGYGGWAGGAYYNQAAFSFTVPAGEYAPTYVSAPCTLTSSLRPHLYGGTEYWLIAWFDLTYPDPSSTGYGIVEELASIHVGWPYAAGTLNSRSLDGPAWFVAGGPIAPAGFAVLVGRKSRRSRSPNTRSMAAR